MTPRGSVLDPAPSVAPAAELELLEVELAKVELGEIYRAEILASTVGPDDLRPASGGQFVAAVWIASLGACTAFWALLIW